MHTRYLSVVVLMLGSFFASSQNWKFLKRVEETTPAWYAQNTPDQIPLDIVNFDQGYYAGQLIEAINQQRSEKNKLPFLQDSLLNRIALAGIQVFNRNSFLNRQTWQRESRSIKYALRRFQSANKIYTAHAFTVDLVDLKFAARFYCNRKIGTSALNLYHGKNPKIHDEEHEEYVVPEPVQAVSSSEFCSRTIHALMKDDADSDFKSDALSAIGVSIKIDKASLNNGLKRPRAFLIVIFAGKMTQHISIPADMQPDGTGNLIVID